MNISVAVRWRVLRGLVSGALVCSVLLVTGATASPAPREPACQVTLAWLRQVMPDVYRVLHREIQVPDGPGTEGRGLPAPLRRFSLWRQCLLIQDVAASRGLA